MSYVTVFKSSQMYCTFDQFSGTSLQLYNPRAEYRWTYLFTRGSLHHPIHRVLFIASQTEGEFKELLIPTKIYTI